MLFRAEPHALKELKQIRKLLETWSPCFQTCRKRSSCFSLKSELQTKTFTQPKATICATSLQKLKIWCCSTSSDNEAAVPHLLALSDRKKSPCFQLPAHGCPTTLVCSGSCPSPSVYLRVQQWQLWAIWEDRVQSWQCNWMGWVFRMVAHSSDVSGILTFSVFNSI